MIKLSKKETSKLNKQLTTIKKVDKKDKGQLYLSFTTNLVNVIYENNYAEILIEVSQNTLGIERIFELNLLEFSNALKLRKESDIELDNNKIIVNRVAFDVKTVEYLKTTNEDSEELGSINIDNKTLLDATLFTSENEMRPILNGVNFNLKSVHNVICINSTDSYRLYNKTVKHNEVIKDDYSFTLPGSVLHLLDKKQDSVITFNKDSAMIKSDNLKIKLKYLSGDYPNIERIAYISDYSTFKVNTKEFISVLKEASKFLKQNKVNYIALDMNEEKLFNKELKYNVNINLLFDIKKYEKCTIGFNPSWMANMLSICNSEFVEVKFTKPNGVMMIEESGVKLVIMPIMLRN